MKLVLALVGVVLLISGAILGATAVQQPVFDFLHGLQTKFTTPLVNRGVDCEATVSPGVNWSGCDKSESTILGPQDNLAEANLSGTNLSASYLNSVDMTSSAIDGLDLSASVVFLVDFSGATGVPLGSEAGFFIVTCPDGTAFANYSGEVSRACPWLPASNDAPAPQQSPQESPDDLQVPDAPPDETEVPAPSTTACLEGIANNGFELTETWTLPETNHPAAYSQDQVHSGSWAMRVGITDPAENKAAVSAVRQSVTIPTAVRQAILSFHIYPQTSEPPHLPLPESEKDVAEIDASGLGDAQWLTIYDDQGQEIEQLLSLRSDSRTWEYYEFNLAGYAGKTVDLYFGVYNNGLEGHTALYVDEVSITSCPDITDQDKPVPDPSQNTVDLPVILGGSETAETIESYP